MSKAKGGLIPVVAMVFVATAIKMSGNDDLWALLLAIIGVGILILSVLGDIYELLRNRK
jgi:hypothetical protein